MAVDDARDLGIAALERLGVDELLDQLGRLRADDVAADQLAVPLVADDLDHAGAVAVDRAGADRAVLDLADHDVDALLARLLLGQPERADGRGAERRARDVDVLDRVGLQPGGVLDGDHALVGGLVRERRAQDQVADRVDALRGGAQRAVDRDQAAVVELDAGLVEPERLDVGPAPGGDDEVVRLALLVAVGERDLVVVRLHVLDQRPRVDRHVLLGELAAGGLGDVGVLGREHAVERLEEQHVGAEPAERGRDLRARRAGADDGERLRQLLQRPRLLGADHAAAELRAGDRLGHRAGREHDRLARLDLRAVDGYLALARERGGPLDVLDLVLLEQARDAARERLDDLLPALEDLAEVDGAVRDLDPVVVGLVDLRQHVGDAQEGLGGDAGVVEAAAADGVLLDHGGAHSELGGADGGDVAARTRADDDAVVGAFRHLAVEPSTRTQKRRTRASASACRAAASPQTPCTAPPGNVEALPRNSPRTGVR